MAKKVDRKTLKWISSLKPEQYVLFRDRKGKLRKNPPANLKIIVEVRDRKSKKLVGFLNRTNKKTKEPIPARFSKQRQRYFKMKRTHPTRAKVVQKSDFVLETNKTILEQIHRKARKSIMLIMAQIKIEKFCRIEVIVRTTLGERRSNRLNFPSGSKFDEIAQIIARTIIDMMRTGEIRISPKAIAAIPNAPHARKLYTTIIQLDSEDLN